MGRRMLHSRCLPEAFYTIWRGFDVPCRNVCCRVRLGSIIVAWEVDVDVNTINHTMRIPSLSPETSDETEWSNIRCFHRKSPGCRRMVVTWSTECLRISHRYTARPSTNQSLNFQTLLHLKQTPPPLRYQNIERIFKTVLSFLTSNTIWKSFPSVFHLRSITSSWGYEWAHRIQPGTLQVGWRFWNYLLRLSN